MGIITYGNTAVSYKDLGSVNNDDLDNIFSLPYNAESHTNLEAAIQLAVSQFNGPSHRSNARKVIVVMASTYNPGGVTAPQQAAEGFKEDGGVLIVYSMFYFLYNIIFTDYVQDHGDPTNTLKEIASPGYFFTTEDSGTSYTDVMNALCDGIFPLILIIFFSQLFPSVT